MDHYVRHSTSQIIIHWLTAGFVILAILLPFCRSWFSDLGLLFMLHKSIGVVIFILTLIRIIVIVRQGLPDVLGPNHRLQRIISKSVQGFIYIALIIMPISGYLMSSRNIDFFGMFTIPSMSLPEEWQSAMHQLHISAAFILIGLIALHGLAALYHHLWVKDNVLRSMWFGKAKNV